MRPVQKTQKLMLYILPDAKRKLDTYVSLALGEISGLGKIKRMERGALLIEDIFIFDQDCTPSHTELNSDAVSDDMLDADLDVATIRLWWHSHGDMDTFWSPEDNETIHGLSNEWMVSLVTNFAGDYLCRLDVYEPMQMTTENVSFQVYLEVDPALVENLRQEVRQKVRHTVPPVFPPGGVYYGLVPANGAVAPRGFEGDED